MTRINVGRVIGGGLVAGLILAVVDVLVEGVWHGQAWEAVAEAHSLNASHTLAAIYYLTAT